MSGAWTAGAALLLLAALPAGPSARARQEDAHRANNRGVALLEQYRHQEAAAAFRAALSLDPALARARLNLAIALLNAPLLEEARREALAAEALMPDAPQPAYVAGLAARGLGASEEAKAAFRRVLQLDGGDVGARVNLAQILMQEGAHAQAAELLRPAAEAEPSHVTVAYNLALALTRAGEAAAGEAAMERFRRLRDSGAGITLGQAYPEQGRHAEGQASTGAEAGLVDPRTPPARFADVTASRLPTPATASDVTLADLDGDGRLDLVLAGEEATRVYLNRAARLRLGFTGPGALRAVAGDVDGDGRRDLVLLRRDGLALLRNEGGRFVDVTAASGLAGAGGPWTSAALCDADHDGDLDLVAGGAAARLFQNDGAARFQDVTATAGLEGASATRAVVPTDFDNHRDVDLLLLSDARRPALWQNRRDGTFADVAAARGLPPSAAYRSLGAGDLNKDGFTDFFFGVADGPGLLALSDGRGGFATAPAPTGTAGAQRAQLLDYDADGLLDVLTVSARGPALLRNLGGRFSDVTMAAFPAAAGAWPLGTAEPALASGDLDGDGDVDLVLVPPSGRVRILHNQGGRGRTLPVRLAARVSNRSGVGAKVEVRAGSLWQKLEAYAAAPAPAPADLVFGLGDRPFADAVRVLWPSGTLQSELVAGGAARRAAMEVKELDRKPSSCPYLYAWNGRSFAFVTDFMGGGEMGYRHAPGVFSVPDPDEYVRLPPEALVEKDGRFELRVTNELEEALFLDHFSLLAVAHPAGVAVFPDEGLRSSPPAFRLFGVRDLRPLAGALDDRGRDVGPRLAATDRSFADGFALHRIRGYAAEHALTLDLGPEAGEDAVLLLTGWTDYAFSSDNVAAHQAGLRLSPPGLETQDGSGAWQVVAAEVGIPVGRPQTLAVPMAGRWRGPGRRVRIVTNMRIYWDQAAVGRLTALEADPVRLLPSRAWLGERGFSAPASAEPLTFDYARVSALSPWKAFPGRYTRTGDVRELLERSDDVFVLSAPGDEVALSFAAAALPALPAGWTRTFLLYADGFSKEMDINSATPDALGPLPYHGMPAYPYAPPAAYPMTAERRALWERYTTRIVRRVVPGIDAALGGTP